MCPKSLSIPRCRRGYSIRSKQGKTQCSELREYGMLCHSLLQISLVCGLFSYSVYNCCSGCSTCSYSYRLCSTRHQLLPSIKHDFLVCYVVVTFSTAFHACFILECFPNDFWSFFLFLNQIRKTLNRLLLQGLYNNSTWICIKAFRRTKLI